MRLMAVVLFASLCAAQTAKHEETAIIFGGTGNDLLNRCSYVDSLKVGETVTPEYLATSAQGSAMCSGYIAGVLDMHEGLYAMGRLRPSRKLYCLPPNVPMTQLVKVVTKALQDNPAELHLPAAGLILVSMQSAFPCR